MHNRAKTTKITKFTKDYSQRNEVQDDSNGVCRYSLSKNDTINYKEKKGETKLTRGNYEIGHWSDSVNNFGTVTLGTTAACPKDDSTMSTLFQIMVSCFAARML
uniref:Uncharacterized protein MANES_05G158800 n=1 Tax=Rhizophora mucronata TaxID=61149 RepID=A0A2P2LJ92_RHIMU